MLRGSSRVTPSKHPPNISFGEMWRIAKAPRLMELLGVVIRARIASRQLQHSGSRHDEPPATRPLTTTQERLLITADTKH